MAGVDVTSYGVYEAAAEIRWDQDEARDIRTLLVATDTSQREVVDGQDLIARWVRGTSPRSSYFQPPPGKQA
jgi:hypothetical protein